MKLNIKNRVLLWGLFASLLIFLLAGAIFLYSVADIRDSLVRHESALGDSVAESVGRLSERNAKERLRESAALKARHIDREIAIFGEDVDYMADRMTKLLSAPEHRLPRALPSTRDNASLLSGMPYIHYSQELSATDIDGMAEELGIVSNFVDTLVLMSKSYAGYRTYFYAASREGYMLCLDITPDGEGHVLPDGEARAEMLSGFDPRERAWYKKGAQAKGAVYSAPYLGIDGSQNIDCVAPYFDGEEFAGVVGIGFPVEEIYRQIADALDDNSRTNFVLDSGGDVVFSSQSSGVLAATPALVDIREAGEETLADAARRMTAGESGVAPVSVDGEMYYLAYAPMKSTGWSFGTLIKLDVVAAPAIEARENVFAAMAGFRATLQDIFGNAKRNAAFSLLIAAPLLLLVGRKLAERITKPILTLTDGVREISAGHLEHKIDVKTGDEIELLAEGFNKMTGELSTYMENMARTAAEKEHIKTELDLARNIQEGMLPKDFPRQQEFSLSAAMHPAKDVGGDFYDFYFLDEDHLAVTVADVSGKGIPAALFMVIAKTLLKDSTIGAKHPEKLSEAVEQANDALIDSNQAGMFVTAFCGVLDLKTGEFHYANAGHNPPLLRHGTDFSFIPKAKSLVLGVMEGEAYPTETIPLAPGDAIFLYTDGVTEAMNENGEMFRENRLQATLKSTPPTADAGALTSAVQEALQAYVGDAEQSDDITMLALVYYGNGQR